ncbi:probable carboxylesterase 17 [Hordeum vulgare subsp. vulgare]|uniref:Alpha/beta hydrolase fold-3 domain-containing protein n=1 Tax=Hordeum vulgare subsp. vulgare TaxID=112509 RepID=A0A8I6YDH7_HORVV|nr:probable carboxylesterase 17 [Hordeum vulgare subsp. vulgare]
MANTTRRKKLVEDIGGWIKVYDDGTVERSPPPPEASQLATAIAPYDVPRDGVTVHDIPSNPPLRLYLPEAARPAGRRLPVLLHFHAGVFCLSDPTWSLYHGFYARLAASIPIAGIVSITLPLAPEHPLPAAIDAGFAAIDWLNSLAQPGLLPEPAGRLKAVADLSRVFLIGDSNGANLVHHVAAGFTSAERGQVRLAGAILLNPGFSRSTPSRSESAEVQVDPYMDYKMVDRFLALALPKGATRDHPYIWPVGDDAAAAALAVPPLLVSVATLDTMRDRQVEYCNVMRRGGKDVEVAQSPGVGHMFYLNQGAPGPADGEAAARVAELIEAIGGFVGRRHGCVARM